MSYDLTARSDEAYSMLLARDLIHKVIKAMPDVNVNGKSGFIFEHEGDIWMEIDVEHVSEEGDNIEENAQIPSVKANCINFHISYSLEKNINSCIKIAFDISETLNWELYDCQTDNVVVDLQNNRPWWKFW